MMSARKIVLWEVDAQADFMLPGGKLYVPGAEKIIPNIERLVKAANETGTLIVASSDAHTENDPEFRRFPPHCVRGTEGARIIPQALAPNFRTIPNDASLTLPKDVMDGPQVIFEKQTLDDFDNPHASELVEQLPKESEFVVFGVATDYCVRYAAKGLLERGRKVSVVTDAIEALDPAAGRRTLDELQAQGARLITTDEALAKLGTPATHR